MKGAVLSRDRRLLSTAALVKATEERGHKVETIDQIVNSVEAGKTPAKTKEKGEETL